MTSLPSFGGIHAGRPSPICSEIRRVERPVAGDLDRIAIANSAFPDHVAVEREAAAVVVDDPLEHRAVLILRVGVVRRHHAASSNLADADDRLAEPDREPVPLALREPFNTADDDVRPQPAVVDAERLERAVGDERHRQHVEAHLPQRVLEEHGVE